MLIPGAPFGATSLHRFALIAIAANQWSFAVSGWPPQPEESPVYPPKTVKIWRIEGDPPPHVSSPGSAKHKGYNGLDVNQIR
jgi:hypothetical protein